MLINKIRQIDQNVMQKRIFLGLVLLIFALPLPQWIYPQLFTSIDLQGKLLTILLFYFLVILCIEVINKRFYIKGRKITLFSIAVLFLNLSILLILSVNKKLALLGIANRSEGYFAFVAYYAIFLVSAHLINREYRKWLLHLFVLFAMIVTILGVLQFTGVLVWNNAYPGMAYVPMTNPNFYGAFAVLFAGVTIGGFLLYRKDSTVTHPFSWWNRIMWYVLMLFGYVACVCADSNLVYVGLVMMFLLVLFLEIVTKQKRFHLLIFMVLGLALVILVLNLIQNGAVFDEISSVFNQIEAEGSVFGDSVGTGRMGAWKRMITMLPEYWLFGCGIEKFGQSYWNKFAGDGTIYFDKAHNEYLHLWITQGIVAILAYLVFLFSLFIPAILHNIKKDDYEVDDVSKIVFIAFFGYISQAFFNISVIQVAPYFWMICGLLCSRKRETE